MNLVKSSNPTSSRPVIIVTGCSSGIGLELAGQLYKRTDFNIVLTARERSLQGLRDMFSDNERVMVRQLDITDEDNIYTLINEVTSEWGRIDTVINNAAVCFRAVVEHMDTDSELMQLKTNYLGPMNLIRAVLPIMREQRSGQIINVSSVSGMLAMPTMGSYSASKHALEGATEALWYEAKPFGIRVNLVQLGFINSSSFKRVVLSHKADISVALGGPHSEYYRSMGPMIEKLMSFSLTSAGSVAKKIIRLIDKPTTLLRVPLTVDATLFAIIKKIIPSFFFNRFLYFLLPGSMKWGGRWKAHKAVLKKKTQAT